MSAVRQDPDAPKRVDPAYSLWVSANAGAGKTHVLIDRIIRLLINGTAPERILCLTFTKAAAAEMATRLSDRLGNYALLGDAALRTELAKLYLDAPSDKILASVRTLFARALETPGGLKIQTIHAFCERLLGRFPIEAGIAPHFEVLDDATQGELLREAQSYVLEHLDDAAAQGWLTRLAHNSDADGFSGLVRDLMRFPPQDDEDPKAGLWAIFGLEAGADETGIRAAALAGFDETGMRRCAQALGEGSKTDCERAGVIAQYIAAPDRGAAFAPYMLAFLTKAGMPRASLATKALCARHPWLADALAAEQARVEQVLNALRTIDAAELAYAALMMGRRVIARYQGMKDARAALDFNDLVARTVDLLERRGAAQWVLFKLDGGLDHILVDEAQDTNPGQWRVIFALAQEFFAGRGARESTRTLFVVGDEKQSIYSFQGADPHAFDRMKNEFETRIGGGGFNWSSHVMGTSWRSTAPVLSLVDAVFAGVSHSVSRHADAGLVEIWPVEKPDPDEPPGVWNLPVDYQSPESPRARLARKIAREVRGWIDNQDLLPSMGRAIRPGDVMILVRRRNGFVDEVIRALKMARIPVAGSDRLSLSEHIAVMDLLALMRFVLLPEDDLNLAVVLKSPLFGFDDERLFALVHDRAGSVIEALRGARGDFELRTVRRLGELQVLGTRMAPYQFLSHVLGPLGGRAAMVSRLGGDANDPIDELLRLALDYEHHSPPSLQGFVNWLEKGQAEVKRDMEHGRDEVRVMTVHGAKGLEANIVILPDTCTLPHEHSRPAFFSIAAPDGRILPVWSQRKGDAPSCLERARGAVNADAAEEHKRLLYVALTRARDRLYVCGYQGKNAPPAESWHTLVTRAMETLADAEAVLREDGTQVLRLTRAQTAPPRPRGGDEAHAPQVMLPAFARTMAPAEPAPLRWLAPSALAGEDDAAEPPARSPLAGAALERTRFLRGRLIHRLLETLPALDPAVRDAAARRFLAQPAHGIDRGAQDDIAQAALRIIADPALAPLFGPGSRAEVPVAGLIRSREGLVPLSGVVDRLAVEDHRVLVIDYKTNRPPPRDAASVPVLYVRQMAAYRQVLRQIYPSRRIECALLWTEGPDLMFLGDAAMDDALAQVSAS